MAYSIPWSTLVPPAQLFRWLVPLAALLLTPMASAAAPPPADSSPPIKVVATIGMIADVAKEIGGPRVRVSSLMGEGVDPHLYKASPGDVRMLSDADIIIYSGLHLEGRMTDILEKLSARRRVVRATAGINEDKLHQPPEFEGQHDPHVWFDVALWAQAAGTIRDGLIATDPKGTDQFNAAADAYLRVLTDLDAYTRQTLATIPAEHRVLVTAHDAFGYFGRAYGLEVLAIQGMSTDSEASLQDINSLVDTLVKRKIPAVFIESSVPRKTIDSLIEGCTARGHAIVVGGQLFSDAMGKAGTLEGTYVGMVLHNIDAITKALGGTVAEHPPGPLADYIARVTSSAPSPATGSK